MPDRPANTYLGYYFSNGSALVSKFTFTHQHHASVMLLSISQEPVLPIKINCRFPWAEKYGTHIQAVYYPTIPGSI